VCKIAWKIPKVYLLSSASLKAEGRSKDRFSERIYFSASMCFPLIYLFRNFFFSLSSFFSPFLCSFFSNSQSLAYSAKFGQIEQLIKLQYVIINRDVSVNVGRWKFSYLSETREGRNRDLSCAEVTLWKRTEKISLLHEVSCAREDRRVYLLEHKNVICL